MAYNLRIPGPTPVPELVRAAMDRQMIDHRAPEFSDLFLRCTARLQDVYRTDGQVLIFPGSGTGGLEAAVVNSFSPGDAVLAVTIGVFGDRFAKIAEAFGLDVRRLSLPRGKAVQPDQLRQALEENNDVAGVLLTHNETSTGVTNPIESLAPLVKARELLLLVDAVSSMGAIPLSMREQRLDIVVSGSQKAWMTPPGLVMVGVASQAWDSVERAKLPRHYWDLRAARASLEKGLTPYTPALSLLYALDTALGLMSREGQEDTWERHRAAGEYTRGAVKELGLELFADERHASNTLTAVKMPEGIDSRAVQARMRMEHAVYAADGQAEMSGRILRLGHMGYFRPDDLEEAVAALGAAVEAERSVVA